LDAEKRAALDEIADGLDRDRSYILNEAIDLYLEVHRWQVTHILEGQTTRNLPRMRKWHRRLHDGVNEDCLDQAGDLRPPPCV